MSKNRTLKYASLNTTDPHSSLKRVVVETSKNPLHLSK